MSHQHLNIFQRAHIEVMLEQKMSIRAIKRKLGWNPSSISRELKRNSISDPYQSEITHKTIKNTDWIVDVSANWLLILLKLLMKNYTLLGRQNKLLVTCFRIHLALKSFIDGPINYYLLNKI